MPKIAIINQSMYKLVIDSDVICHYHFTIKILSNITKRSADGNNLDITVRTAGGDLVQSWLAIPALVCFLDLVAQHEVQCRC